MRPMACRAGIDAAIPARWRLTRTDASSRRCVSGLSIRRVRGRACVMVLAVPRTRAGFWACWQRSRRELDHLNTPSAVATSRLSEEVRMGSVSVVVGHF